MKYLTTLTALLFFFLASPFVQDDDESLDIELRHLLRNNDLLDDAAVLPHQRAEFRAIYRAAALERQELMQQPGFTTNQFEALDKRTLRKIWFDVLLDAQRKRFVQLLNQRKLAKTSGSYAGFMFNDGRELLQKAEAELTEGQVDELRKVSEKTLEQLKKESRKYLQAVADTLTEEKTRVNELLDESQRPIFEDLFGEQVFGAEDGERIATSVLNRFVYDLKAERRLKAREELKNK